jgi:hypothetical protein
VSYLVETESFGRKEFKIDLPRFATDVAAALTALLPETAVQVMPAGDYPAENQTIRVGNDNVNLHADNWKKKVTASIAAPELKWGERNTYDKSHRTENASVNPNGRKVASIAADINRRVIVASQEALAKQREYAAAQVVAKAEIVRLANALKERLPGIDIRVNEQDKRATVYSGTTGHYFSGTLTVDGTVTIERVGSVPMDKFARIVAILNEGGDQ